MAKRDNHYEAALEAYLRWLAIPYVAVDETRRSLAGDKTLKSLDFIVSPPQVPGSLLIDVKGRRFPTAGKQYWRNWCTREELSSLAAWEELLGPQAAGLLGLCLQRRRRPRPVASRGTVRLSRQLVRLRRDPPGPLFVLRQTALRAVGYGQCSHRPVSCAGPPAAGSLRSRAASRGGSGMNKQNSECRIQKEFIKTFCIHHSEF